MKTFKRFLASMLCVVIVLTAAPLSGFVGLEFPEWNLFDFSMETEAKTYSGSCGTNVNWSLDTSTGVLDITGTGAIKAYSSNTSPPWSSYYFNTVNIAEGITSIGSYAFYDCAQMKTITLPNSIVSIGEYAFFSCDGLISITIPEGVRGIVSSVFRGCNNLKIVMIPSSVTYIDPYAFFYCDNLKYVAYAGTAEEWDDISIYSYNTPVTSAKKYYQTNKIEHKLENGFEYIIIDEFAELICYSGVDSQVIIPEKTDGKDVISINKDAFKNNTTIISITIPDSVTSIGDYAFYGCSKIKKLVMPVSAKIYNSSCVFHNCTNIEKVTLTKGTGIMQDYSLSTSSSYYQYTPWYKSNSKEIIIEEGVTSISNYAFYGCTGLTSITIPESITSIGDDAFYDCTSLTDVYYTGDVVSWCNVSFESLSANPMCYAKSFYINNTLIKEILIPDTITEIKPYTFYSFNEITSVTIPDSVTSIGDYAFYDCDSLTSVTIPGSIESVDVDAFYGCINLDELYYIGDINDWCSITFANCYANPMCYAKNLYINNTLVKEVVIPKTITEIKDYSFYSFDNLTVITIPDSIINIGDSAFYDCTDITIICFSGTEEQWNSIIVDSGNDILENATIYYNYHSGSNEFSNYSYLLKVDGTIQLFSYSGTDTTVTIPAEIDGYKVSGIYSCAFADNTAITAFSVDSANEYLSSENGIIYSKDKTQLIAYPAGKTDANITIPVNVISFADDAFLNNTKLKNVYYEGTVADWCAIDFADENANPLSIANNLFIGGYAIVFLSIPDGVEKVNNYVFYNCESIANVTVSDSVKVIGEKAFADSYATAVTLGAGITEIGSSAFAGCTDIADVYYPGTAVQFADVKIADGNETLIGANIHFEYKSEIKPIESGKCGDNLYWSYYDDGRLVISGAGDTTSAPWSSYSSSIKTVTITEGVTNICKNAFSNCLELEAVIYSGTEENSREISIATGNSELIFAKWFYGDYIPEFKSEGYFEYIIVGDEAVVSSYSGADFKVIIPSEIDGKKVVSLGKYLFNNSTTITDVVIPDGVTSIGYYAFNGCTSLASIEIPDSVTSIVAYAFYGCRSLASIEIPDSVTSIAAYAFYGCRSLTSVTIPDSVTSIGDYAFCYCTGLKELTMPASAKIYNSFYNCKNIEKVTLTKGTGMMQNYGDDNSNSASNTYYQYAPWYISKCAEVVIEDGVTSIGKYAFCGCDSLTSVAIGSSVKSIGEEAFSDCTSLTDIYYAGNIESWCNISFDSGTANPMCFAKNFYINNTLLTEFVIPDAVTKIKDYAFYRFEGITSVTIPDSVKSIGEDAFYDCDSLTSVTIPDSVTSIGSYAFSDCTSLTSVTIGNSVTSIGSCAFSDCTSLTSVTIPDSVTSIGKYAFCGCTSLIDIYYMGDIESWCNISFDDGYANPMENAKNFYIDNTLITEIVIPDAVTKIKDYAFYDFDGITSITIPDSVTSIGKYAFYDCDSLTSVAIGNSVKSIGDYAFYYCDGLTSVTISDSVTSIGKFAFYYCDSLTSVTIHDSVTSIGSYAFYGCSKLSKVFYNGTQSEWNSISIGTSNDPLKSATKYYNHVHSYNEVVDIPSTCETHGRNILVCECGKISGYVTAPLSDCIAGEWEIITPEGCETEGYRIKKCSFCSKLMESETIPSLGGHTPGNWEESVLAGCVTEGKMIQKCVVCSEELLSSPTPALGHTPGKWETEIPAGCVTDGKIVQRCTVCFEVVLSSPTPALGGHISGEWKITTYPTTSSKGEKTHYCSRCNEGYETEQLSELDTIFDYLQWAVNDDNTVTITKCDKEYTGEISIPADVYGYPVTGIACDAFDNCDNITKIIIPASADIIGEDFARFCDNLEGIIVNSANKKLSSENGVLYNKDKTRIIVVPAKAVDGEFVMPSSVIVFDKYAFATLEGIVLTISDNLYLGDFSNVRVDEFIVSDSCVNFTVEDGVLFNKDKTILVRFTTSSDTTEYVVPDGVTTIGDYAFYKSSLKRLGLPETIVGCGLSAFYDCILLERVDFPCLDCWCKIDFANYSGVEWINGTALYIDDVLVDGLDVGVKHPENFTVINDEVFTGYKYFRKVIVPSRVTKIGDRAFYLCENVEVLYIYGDVTEWGQWAFKSCNKIHTIYLGEGITKITGELVLSVGGYNSKHLYIPESLTYIGDSVFWGNNEQHFETICYAGTASQWENVTVSFNNFMLNNATLLYHEHGSYHYTTEGAKDPTCTEDGYTGNLVHAYCGFCIELGEVIPATGHNYEMVSSSDATCTEDGGTTYKCLTCGDIYTDVEQKTGHTMGENEIIKEPTCSKPGEKRCVCTVCGETYIEEISTISHTESVAVKENFVDSTCIEKGHYDSVVYCSVCGEELSTEVVEVDFVGHTEGKTVEENIIDSTCTEKGSYESVIYCTVCGKEISRETKSIPAKGHSWSEWETTISPTTTIDGVKVRECLVCGEGENGIVPKTGITVILTDSNGNVVSEQVIEGDLSEVTFDGIEDGEYTVTISKETYASREYTVTAIDGKAETEFKLNHTGDINGDGKISVLDYTQLLRHVKKTSSLDGYAFDCADVNGDGKLSVLDYTKLLRHVKKTEMLW